MLDKEYLQLMADPKENEEINEELSMDELKDVAGGGMGLDRLGTQFRSKRVQKNPVEPETKVSTDPWDK